jgi:hypothetical protein
MIQYHYSILSSRSLLEEILEETNAIWQGNGHITVRHWSNGREQGYSLHYHYSKFYQILNFAQQRNSDNFVIIEGNQFDFDVSTNMPSDTLWKTCKILDRKTAKKRIQEWILLFNIWRKQ